MEIKPITFFRKELDTILDFLLRISEPKYLTKDGQKEVDKLLHAMNIISKKYLNCLGDKTED